MKNYLNIIMDQSVWVTEHSNTVRIDHLAIDSLVDQLARSGIERPDFGDIEYMKFVSQEDLARYCLVLDALNYLTWQIGDTAVWEYNYEGSWVSGWYGWVRALQVCLEKDPTWLEPERLASLTMEDLVKVLGGRGELQLLDTRLSGLQEIGTMLGELGRLGFLSVIENYDWNASRIVEWLSINVRHFNDAAIYNGRDVGFYKRAQHFCVMFWGLSRLAGWKTLEGVEDLTILPDQKIPQILRHYGVLIYSNQLAEQIDTRHLLLSGSAEEVEIRAASIVAGEYITRACRKRGLSLMTLELDVNLWILSHNQLGMKPSHRVISINY